MVDARNAARLTLFVALATLLLALASLPLSGNLEQQAGVLVARPAAAIRDATRPLADVILNAGQVRELSEENAELRRRVARLEAEAAALRESAVAAHAVTSLLNAVGDDAGGFLPASVVLRDPAPASNGLVVDRGAADGVATGQPVLGPGATLVGIVSAVDPDRSRIRLLSDGASAVTAVVQEPRVPGALAGTRDGLRLEFVPVDAPVGAGDLVLTSALGGRLPGGLLIGRVVSVEAPGQALFATVVVEPLADYARLEQVLILTNPVVLESTALESAGRSE
ncbi:MAG: rod shape-determining protein MreC [Dehalococcoidia bacterium]|nr:rod shape-determining protein MreC [Dehalococcoidia bacterium]